jgi:hypothetical protein
MLAVWARTTAGRYLVSTRSLRSSFGVSAVAPRSLPPKRRPLPARFTPTPRALPNDRSPCAEQVPVPLMPMTSRFRSISGFWVPVKNATRFQKRSKRHYRAPDGAKTRERQDDRRAGVRVSRNVRRSIDTNLACPTARLGVEIRRRFGAPRRGVSSAGRCGGRTRRRRRRTRFPALRCSSRAPRSRPARAVNSA